MGFFLSPLYAISNIASYGWASRWRLAQAFQYLAYLALLTTLLSVFLIAQRALPVTDRFVEWVKSEMPALTVTDAGIVMNAQSPYTMVHPVLGPLVRFDMTVADADPEDLSDFWLFVTAERVYFRQGQDIRVYDIAAQLRKNTGDFEVAFVTPATVDEFYRSLKPWLLLFAALLIFVFFFVWKSIAALFYAWMGLLFNMSGPEKLSFTAIYCISIFAMTASVLFQWLRLLVPALNVPGVALAVHFILTVVYLYLAVKKLEKPSA